MVDALGKPAVSHLPPGQASDLEGADALLPVPKPRCSSWQRIWSGSIDDGPERAARPAGQAFQLGASVGAIGLQSHLAATPAGVASLVEHCGHELTAGAACVQSRDQVLGAPATAYRAMHG